MQIRRRHPISGKRGAGACSLGLSPNRRSVSPCATGPRAELAPSPPASKTRSLPQIVLSHRQQGGTVDPRGTPHLTPAPGGKACFQPRPGLRKLRGGDSSTHSPSFGPCSMISIGRGPDGALSQTVARAGPREKRSGKRAASGRGADVTSAKQGVSQGSVEAEVRRGSGAGWLKGRTCAAVWNVIGGGLVLPKPNYLSLLSLTFLLLPLPTITSIIIILLHTRF